MELSFKLSSLTHAPTEAAIRNRSIPNAFLITISISMHIHNTKMFHATQRILNFQLNAIIDPSVLKSFTYTRRIPFKIETLITRSLSLSWIEWDETGELSFA